MQTMKLSEHLKQLEQQDRTLRDETIPMQETELESRKDQLRESEDHLKRNESGQQSSGDDYISNAVIQAKNLLDSQNLKIEKLTMNRTKLERQLKDLQDNR